MLNMIKNILKTPEASTFSYFRDLGEEGGVADLVLDFYRYMETDPKAKDCLDLHELTKEGKVSADSIQKLTYFIIGWLGGPNLFVQNFGPPMMRKRHLHLRIGQNESEQWLYCMELALKKHKSKLNRKKRKELMNSFRALTMRIQNS